MRVRNLSRDEAAAGIRSTLAICLGSLLLGVGCSAVSADEAGDVTNTLINGSVVADSEYPSAIAVLWSGSNVVKCTGAKVGPRHILTAAHCVFIEETKRIDPWFQAGVELSFTTGNDVKSATRRKARITKLHLHDAWLKGCAAHCWAEPAPDVALIEIDQDTPDIPVATIDASPVESGDGVVMTGYGCQKDRQSSTGTGVLKAGATTVPVSGSVPIIQDENNHYWLAQSIVTVGAHLVPGAPSGCNGDSGAPVYRDSAKVWMVGVYSGTINDSVDQSLPSLNRISRVDASAQVPIARWLEERGASVGRSIPAAIPWGDALHEIPGKLEAEHYDRGGQGLAYNDTTAINYPLASFRTGGVDIDVTPDSGGGFNVGGVSAGEWLNFTSHVLNDGRYELEIRAATIKEAKLHVEVDGKNVTGSIAIPSTGGWQTYQTTKHGDVQLSKGSHSVRVVFETDGINLNWITFALSACVRPDGGPACGALCSEKCADGRACEVAEDCASGRCVDETCQPENPLNNAAGQSGAAVGNAGAGAQPGATAAHGGVGGHGGTSGATASNPKAGTGSTARGTARSDGSESGSSCSLSANHKTGHGVILSALALGMLSMRRRRGRLAFDLEQHASGPCWRQEYGGSSYL